MKFFLFLVKIPEGRLGSSYYLKCLICFDMVLQVVFFYVYYIVTKDMIVKLDIFSVIQCVHQGAFKSVHM